MFSCSTQGFLPFQDPKVDSVQELVKAMKQRILLEENHRSLNATEYEQSEKHLERFLKLHFQDIEVALNRWHGWVEWRHVNEIDKITDADVSNELNEGIFSWRGKNKQGMQCCVITARMLRPEDRKGTFNSFKKHLLRFVDEGMRRADETDQDKICIIYDRRGLEYENIDPNLYQFCKKAIDEMREWYGNRIGAVYVVHVNMMFWLLYTVLLFPIMYMWSSSDRMIILNEAEELLQYFDEDQLQLLKFDGPATTTPPTAPSSTASS